MIIYISSGEQQRKQRDNKETTKRQQRDNKETTNEVAQQTKTKYAVVAELAYAQD